MKQLALLALGLTVNAPVLAQADPAHEDIDTMGQPTDASTSLIPAIELTGVMAGVTAQLYGYIKADMSYATDGVSNGEFGRAVVPDAGDQFNMTARQTRFGFKFGGPEDAAIRTTGKVEMDFYGGGTSNSATPRLRHAFVNLDFVDQNLSVLAGTTSDVISPLVPSTINYTVNWWQGNQGFRRNQVRLTKTFPTGDDTRFTLQGAVTHRSESDDPGRPGFQVRGAYTFPGPGGATTIGLSAHDSREIGGADSNSINVDLNMPINETFGLKAEYFAGENLDAYLGFLDATGTTGGTDVNTMGYWFALNIKGSEKMTYNVGLATQTSDDDDLAGGDIEENGALWANAIRSVNANTKVGLELSHLGTDYIGGDDEDSFRIQAALQFSF